MKIPFDPSLVLIGGRWQHPAAGRSDHGREKGFEALYGFSVLKTVAAHHD